MFADKPLAASSSTKAATVWRIQLVDTPGHTQPTNRLLRARAGAPVTVVAATTGTAPAIPTGPAPTAPGPPSRRSPSESAGVEDDCCETPVVGSFSSSNANRCSSNSAAPADWDRRRAPLRSSSVRG